MSTSVDGMKILFVIDSLGAGGAERSLAELLPALEDAGIEAIIACLDRRTYGVEAEVLASGADVRFLPRRPIARLRELRRIVAKESPDLIHTTILASNLAGRLASIGSPATVLTSLVNTPYAPIRKQDPRVRPLALSAIRLIDIATARRLTDHFHAITEAVKSWAVADMGLDPGRITVVHRGRNPDRLGEPSPERRRSARHALGLRDEDEVVLSVGRQEFQKGQRYLLEAVAALAPRRPRAAAPDRRPARRVVSGARSVARRPRARGAGARPRPSGGCAGPVGRVGPVRVPVALRRAGGSVLEAMALGLPIVASDLPAVREIVEEGENALLVPVAAADELARRDRSDPPGSEPGSRVRATEPRDLPGAVHLDPKHRGHDRPVPPPGARFHPASGRSTMTPDAPGDRLRVLHVITTGDRRGAEMFAADLIRALAESGIDQRVAVLRGSPPYPAGFEAPVDVLSSGRGRLIPGLRMDPMIAWRLRSLCRRWRPHVVQVHGGEPFKYAALVAGRRDRIVYRRIGLSPERATRGLTGRTYRLLMRRCRMIVAVAEAVRRETIDAFGVAADRVVTIPRGVDPGRVGSSLGRDGSRRRLGIADGCPRGHLAGRAVVGEGPVGPARGDGRRPPRPAGIGPSDRG